MLSERDRHTLHGLYALRPGTYYTLTLQEGDVGTHFSVQRGAEAIHVNVQAMQRLDLDLISGGCLVTPGRITPLHRYQTDPAVRQALASGVLASAARHPSLGATLTRTCTHLRRCPGQRLTLLSPDLLDEVATQLLARHHALPSGPYTLHLQRHSPRHLDTSYVVTDPQGRVMPLTEQALRDLMIVQPGEDVMLLRRPTGAFEAIPTRHYQLNPAAHQPGVSAWALNHSQYAPLRQDLRSRGATDRAAPSSPYDLSVPLMT